MNSYFEPRVHDTLRAAAHDIVYPLVRDIACSVKHTYTYLGRTVTLFPQDVTRVFLIFRDTIAQLHAKIEQIIQELKKFALAAMSVTVIKPPFENIPPLFKNYSFRPRSAKKTYSKNTCSTDPSIHIDSQEIALLCTNAKNKNAVETNVLGKGIQNGGNSCYIAAVLQMLRVTKLFRARLECVELKNDELATRIKKIFHSIERGQNTSQKSLPAHEINDFRRFLIKQGWNAEREYSQEDADQLCSFLIDRLRFSPFEIKTQITPIDEQEDTYHSIKAQGGCTNSLPLALGKAKEDSELSQIVVENIVVEEVTEPKAPPRLVETLQTVKMRSDNIPHFMPISLKRFSFDPKTNSSSKIRTAIHPSDYIDFPIEKQKNFSARYRLSAIVSHIGLTPSAGHYICYVPAMTKTQKVYFEFNDSTTKMHFKDTAIKNSLEKDGYVFMYELDRIIKN